MRDWKGKGPASSQYNKDYHPKRIQQRTRRELRVPSMDLKQWSEGFNVTFKDLVFKILKCIKNEPYFRWLRKIGGDPTRRNQSCIVLTIERKAILSSSAMC